MDKTETLDFTEQHKAKFQTLLTRSAELLCENHEPGDHFTYRPINASSILRLQLTYKKENKLELLFLFPRRSQFKPLYKDVRSWFEAEGLEWKDRQVDGKRYMAAAIPRNSTEIARLVNSFLKAQWSYEVLIISSGKLSLSYKLMKLSLTGAIIGLLALFVSTLTLILHQITKIGKIEVPSFTNISKFEWLMMGIAIAAGIILNRVLSRAINQRYSPYSKAHIRKIWRWRIGVTLCFFLIPSVTGI